MDPLPSLNDNKSLRSRSKVSAEALDRGSEEASALAIAALSFIAADPVLLGRFMALTGLDVASIRRAAASPGFLPGVLDFILAHEPTLVAFAANAGIDPSRLAGARQRLGRNAGEGDPDAYASMGPGDEA